MIKVRLGSVVAALLMLLSFQKSYAAPGDTTAVHVYQDQVIVTNPGTGSNKYYQWAEFPDSSVSYGKVIMYLTYQCPNNMNCAEWDYLDPISFGRPAGVNSDTLNWEFARFITPYGNYWGAGSNFKHGWYYDVTDFAPMFHDSVEIIYNHTGFETNSVGWKINITFLFIEGTPDRDVQNITPIYSGSYPYNSNIESSLSAQSLTYTANTEEARIKIIQSGHGMNDQNCSEFCAKQRWVKYDGNTVNQRMMWRECGFNSLFPQAGTWLYDRGNWCPGASVRYDDIDIHNVVAGSTHTFDIDMETVGAGNFGNQVITAYVIEYGDPNYITDVSLESIVAPSKEYEFSRMNPICAEPVIVIKNFGTAPLTSLDVVYGVPGGTQSTYSWTGNLSYLGVDTVRITQPVNWTPNTNTFQVQLQNPNGLTDENTTNNFGSCSFTTPQTINLTDMVILFKPNNAPGENHYRFIDMTTGTVISDKNNFTMPHFQYRDTVQLTPGHCYHFEFFDDGPPPTSNPLNNDGLDWWANPDDSSGYVRFLRLSNATIKGFQADFGTKFYYEFMCTFPLGISNVDEKTISAMVYPNPSSDGLFYVDYTLPGNKAELQIFNMVGVKVYSKSLSAASGHEQISLAGFAKGHYLIKLVSADGLTNIQKVLYQ